MVNLPLHTHHIPEEKRNFQIILLHLHIRYYALVIPKISSLLMGGHLCAHKGSLSAVLCGQ